MSNSSSIKIYLKIIILYTNVACREKKGFTDNQRNTLSEKQLFWREYNWNRVVIGHILKFFISCSNSNLN